MDKQTKADDAREQMLNNDETEFVISNSPDDTPMNHNGDEESIIKVDSPDDAKVDNAKMWERIANSGIVKK